MAVNVGAYSQDILTRIYNVQWGGQPVFIYGTDSGNKLYYVSFKSNENGPILKTITLPEPPAAEPGPDPMPSFGIRAGSYHMVVTNKDTPNERKTPTFLISGIRVIPHTVDDTVGNEVLVYDYFAIIYASNDGLDWREVHREDATRPTYDTVHQVSPIALVWSPSEEAFYYDQNYLTIENVHAATPQQIREHVFKSSDGESWSKISEVDVGDDPSSYRSTYPTLYCSHNDCFDSFDQHVPDGVMGKNSIKSEAPEKPVEVEPVEVGVYNYWGGSRSYGASSEVKIVLADGTSSTKSVPVERVHCVAMEAGIIMVGGMIGEDTSGMVAFSVDDGKTWTQLSSTPDKVTTLIAGLAR